MMRAASRHLQFLALAGLLLVSAACGRDESTSTASSTPGESAITTEPRTPEQLGEIGAQIEKEPQRGDAILTQHGMTRESFESEIRAVTENVDSARRYAAAYRKTGA